MSFGSLLENFNTVLSVLLGIIGIISFLLPLQSKYQRLVHIAYGLFIMAITTVAFFYWQDNQRIHKVEHAACLLVQDHRMKYVNTGFTQAALTFLEKNKDLYPDSYERAKEICKQNNCLGPEHAPNQDSLHYDLNQNNVSWTMQGIIRGIASLENDKGCQD